MCHSFLFAYHSFPCHLCVKNTWHVLSDFTEQKGCNWSRRPVKNPVKGYLEGTQYSDSVSIVTYSKTERSIKIFGCYWQIISHCSVIVIENLSEAHVLAHSNHTGHWQPSKWKGKWVEAVGKLQRTLLKVWASHIDVISLSQPIKCLSVITGGYPSFIYFYNCLW